MTVTASQEASCICAGLHTMLGRFVEGVMRRSPSSISDCRRTQGVGIFRTLDYFTNSRQGKLACHEHSAQPRAGKERVNIGSLLTFVGSDVIGAPLRPASHVAAQCGGGTTAVFFLTVRH